MSELLEGTVRHVNERRFGFISTPGREDIFFHANDLEPGLEFDGLLLERRVVFEIGDGKRGPRAVNVRPAD